MRAVISLATLLLAGAVAGEDASYLLRGPQRPIKVAVNGYVQQVERVDEGAVRVRVITSMAPIGASGRLDELQRATEVRVPDGFVMPSSLRRAVRDEGEAFDAATTILSWVSRHVRLVEGDLEPQDAPSVLDRRRGRCSGLANAAAALLMAAGFEARTVGGLLITAGGPIPHRWVECRLPGAGWVPSDPTLGLWVVTSAHLTFDEPVMSLPHMERVDRGSARAPVLPRRDGLPQRPNRGAELVCRLIDGTGDSLAVARLTGPGGDERRSRLDPEGRFEGLLPGRWTLEVEIDGELAARRDLVLGDGETYSVAVRDERRLEVG